MSQTFAKMIDNNNIGGSLITSNGIDFISFNFTVYENSNIVDEIYDSVHTYTYVSPISQFSKLLNYDGDTGLCNQINLQFGKTHVSFNRGEYVDLAGNVFDPADIESVLQSILPLV